MPVMTEEAFWQHLQSDQFTTPLLREWVPWLHQKMKEREVIVELKQSGCQAGLSLANNDVLDELGERGHQERQLTIGGRVSNRSPDRNPRSMKDIKNLDQYMLAYGSMLGKQAERALNPLHVPGRDSLSSLELLRDPFEAQSHVIEATRKALYSAEVAVLVGEMGTGKTLMGMAAIHAHAAGKPYRALVFCPGQLVNKWEREIRETIPDAEVIQIENWTNLLHLDRTKKPGHVEWYVIARDRAKLGAKWRPAFYRRKHTFDGFIRCPGCGRRLVDEEREPHLRRQARKHGSARHGSLEKSCPVRMGLVERSAADERWKPSCRRMWLAVVADDRRTVAL